MVKCCHSHSLCQWISVFDANVNVRDDLIHVDVFVDWVVHSHHRAVEIGSFCQHNNSTVTFSRALFPKVRDVWTVSHACLRAMVVASLLENTAGN